MDPYAIKSPLLICYISNVYIHKKWNCVRKIRKTDSLQWVTNNILNYVFIKLKGRSIQNFH